MIGQHNLYQQIKRSKPGNEIKQWRIIVNDFKSTQLIHMNKRVLMQFPYMSVRHKYIYCSNNVSWHSFWNQMWYNILNNYWLLVEKSKLSSFDNYVIDKKSSSRYDIDIKRFGFNWFKKAFIPHLIWGFPFRVFIRKNKQQQIIEFCWSFTLLKSILLLVILQQNKVIQYQLLYVNPWTTSWYIISLMNNRNKWQNSTCYQCNQAIIIKRSPGTRKNKEKSNCSW